MKKRTWFILLLCLTLPFSALAVTEGEVEDAPMVDTQLDSWQTETSYLPDASYYGHGESEPIWADSDTWYECEIDVDGYFAHTTQNPHLTAGEIRRAQRLSADYYAGKAVFTGESVLEKMEDVIVGVYALNPADFDGEHAYVILPGTCLTDEQLLSIIAAYDQLGLVFQPDSLNYRNCSRGGGIDTTRFMTDEEWEKYVYLANCIRLGKLIPPEGIEKQLRNPTLVEEYFCGLDDFSLTPYRHMTDEEMVALLVSIGVHDERGEIDHTAVEARGRSALYQVLHCPLSMSFLQIDKDGMYTPMLFTSSGEQEYDHSSHRAFYAARFTYVTPDDTLTDAYALFDKETDALVVLGFMHSNPNRDAQFALSRIVTQDMVDAATAQVEKNLNLSGLKWHTLWEQNMATNWGNCVPARAVVTENWLLTAYVGCDDGQLHGIELTYGTLVDELPAEEMRPNG